MDKENTKKDKEMQCGFCNNALKIFQKFSNIETRFRFNAFATRETGVKSVGDIFG